MRQAVRLFLKSIGEDPDREGLLDTPDRIGRACKELFAGLGHGPEEVLKTKFKSIPTKWCWYAILNSSRYANTTCCRSMAWPTSAIFRRTAKWRLKQACTTGGTVCPTSASAGAPHPTGGRRVDGRYRSTWRDRSHRMRSHVHGHAWRKEGAIAYGYIGGARLHARRDDASRSHEPDPVAACVIGVTAASRIVNTNNRI